MSGTTRIARERHASSGRHTMLVTSLAHVGGAAHVAGDETAVAPMHDEHEIGRQPELRDGARAAAQRDDDERTRRPREHRQRDRALLPRRQGQRERDGKHRKRGQPHADADDAGRTEHHVNGRRQAHAAHCTPNATRRAIVLMAERPSRSLAETARLRSRRRRLKANSRFLASLGMRPMGGSRRRRANYLPAAVAPAVPLRLLHVLRQRQPRLDDGIRVERHALDARGPPATPPDPDGRTAPARRCRRTCRASGTP